MLFERIQNSLSTLSEAKKQVAYYLMENWFDAAFQNIATIAKLANVSESVVVRFSQDIGYSGFPELQKDLQKILKSRLAATHINAESLEETEAIQNSTSLLEDKDDFIYPVFQNSIQNMKNVIDFNTTEKFITFLRKIKEAQKVIILARKNSMGAAYILNIHINELYSKSFLLNGETVEALDMIRNLTSDDLVVFISIPALSKRMVQYSDYLAKKDIPQISIVNTHSNPIAENSEVYLLTSVNSSSFSNTHLATVFIIDVLNYMLTRKMNPKILKSLEEIKVLNDRFNISEH